MANEKEKTGAAGLSDNQKEVIDNKPEPNIIFVGNGEPLTKINNGAEVIKLPKIEEQAEITEEPAESTKDRTYDEGVTVTKYKGKPFYHEKASTIVQLFGGHYKFFKPKGK